LNFQNAVFNIFGNSKHAVKALFDDCTLKL